MYAAIKNFVDTHGLRIEVKPTDKSTGFGRMRARNPVHAWKDRTTGKVTKITVNAFIVRQMTQVQQDECVGVVVTRLLKDVGLPV